MPAELKLLSIPEVMAMAKGSVDLGNVNGEVDWWRLFSAKVNKYHFDELVDEIAENGFGMPIVLCDRYGDDNYVIGNGHHRLAAAILLGLWRIPVMVSTGANRDDFMRPQDSMDDEQRPIDGNGHYEYWNLLSQNMESDSYGNDYSDDSPEQFYCELCGEYLNIGTHCCDSCHYAAAHPKCRVCEGYDCEIDHICDHCDAEAAEYRDHKIGCPERDWETIGHWGSAANHYRFIACPVCRERDHDDALSEDYQFEADYARLVAVGAAAPRIPAGMWHPDAILSDAYYMHEEWLADAPMREARAEWLKAIQDMRQAVNDGLSDAIISAFARDINRAHEAYVAL